MEVEAIQNLPAMKDLYDRGLNIVIEPKVAIFNEESDQAYIACLLARDNGDETWSVELAVVPDAGAEELDFLARDYLAPVLERLANHGPDPDGWQLRSDGDYQKWLRFHDFGDVADM